MPRVISLSLLLLLLNLPIVGVVADDLPPVLDFSTYAGGSGFVEGEAVAVDAQGNIYLTGNTNSTAFPASNPFNLNLPDDGTDLMYVMKFDPTATTVLYSVFLGEGIAKGIEVDADGYAYVTGEARGVIPIKNAIQNNLQGSNDAFVTRLSPSGQDAVFSTYLGGSGFDLAWGIGLDASNNVYISGATGSTDFPTRNAVQPTLGAPADAFITKFNASGELVYSTYYGGSKEDGSYDVVVDGAGNAYITGYTLSEDWPTVNPYQAAHATPCAIQCWDGFVAKFSPSGAPIYSSYLGGDSGGGAYEAGFGVAVDAAGSLYVTGLTSSDNFPTMNPYQANNTSTYEAAFVTKFSPDGSELIYSTYLGGSSQDTEGWSLAVDANGNAYVGGTTSAPDFPVVRPIQATRGGTAAFFDAFLTQFSADGQTLLFSTYLGGSHDDAFNGFGLAYHPNGSVILGGTTESTDFPLLFPSQSTGGGFLTTRTAFLAKISFAPMTSTEDVLEPHFYTTQTPTLTWTPITYTTRYHIQVSLDPSFTDPLEFETVVEVSDLALPHYPRIVTDPLMNGRHYWRVQAATLNGSWGEWSQVDSFTVRANP